jgi:hypothetical protein
MWVWIRYFFMFKSCFLSASFALMARMAHVTMKHTLLHLEMLIKIYNEFGIKKKFNDN